MCSVRKDVLRNFATFTGKHVCQSLFFSCSPPATLLKKILRHRCFPVNFAKFLRTPFLHNTSRRLFLYLALNNLIYLDKSERSDSSQDEYENIANLLINVCRGYHILVKFLPRGRGRYPRVLRVL